MVLYPPDVSIEIFDEFADCRELIRLLTFLVMFMVSFACMVVISYEELSVSDVCQRIPISMRLALCRRYFPNLNLDNTAIGLLNFLMKE